MPRDLTYADLCPKDPRAPFDNPTEEPDYSPDYREIVPTLDMPQSRLPLLPSEGERTRIRRYYSLTCLILLFSFLLAVTVQLGLTLLISAALRNADLQAAGELPANYPSILKQYFSNSSIMPAMTLLCFLTANLTAFFVGCRFTRIQPKDCFRTRDLRLSSLLAYLLLGLWIQVISGYLAGFVSAVLTHLGIRAASASALTVSGSMHKLAVTVLYAGVVAPVTEELLLRGLVLKNFCRVSQRHGIFLSALLFGVMHDNLLQFLPAFLLGILLAYITIRHNSVVPAIAVHITVNTVQTLLKLSEAYLPKHVSTQISTIYTLAVILIGTIVLTYTLMTERLPATTPHQSMRGWHIICSSPVFWLLLTVHISAALYQAGMLRLPSVFQSILTD